MVIRIRKAEQSFVRKKQFFMFTRLIVRITGINLPRIKVGNLIITGVLLTLVFLNRSFVIYIHDKKAEAEKPEE